MTSTASSSPSSSSSSTPPVGDESPTSLSNATERLYLTPPPQRSPEQPEPPQRVPQELTFNHNPLGPFAAPSRPARPQAPPASFLPQPIPALPFLIPATHAAPAAFLPCFYQHANPAAITHLPFLPHPLKNEAGHSMLRHANRNLPELIIEPVREEPGSPRPSSSMTSSFTASSPRSVGMSPTGSHPGDGPTPPPSASGSRKRRRQDTLIPEGCPLTKKVCYQLHQLIYYIEWCH